MRLKNEYTQTSWTIITVSRRYTHIYTAGNGNDRDAVWMDLNSRDNFYDQPSYLYFDTESRSTCCLFHPF